MFTKKLDIKIQVGAASMEIRRYKLGEEMELMDIFYSAIRENARGYYNDDQLIAWAPDEIDRELWTQRIHGINPYVVVEGSMILGYADLQDSGYIDHFFVRGGYSKRGVGSRLMNHIIEEAKRRSIAELSSDVSLAAQDFFKRFGFEVIQRKEVEVRGVMLENARMILKLSIT